jgi:sorbose reductase
MAENMRDGKFVHNSTAPPSEHRVLPLFSLAGRTAIVSGAGAGIGLAVARGFAEAGANVAIWYNSNKSALSRAEEIERDYGVRCRAYQVNVTSPEAVETAVDQIVGEFGGRLDVFVANSGVAWEQGPMLDGGLDHYRKVTSTNVDGTFYCARAAGKHFRRQKREGTTLDGKKLDGFNQGSFIATASMSGHIANIPQLQAAYNASKAAVIHLCKLTSSEGGRQERRERGEPESRGKRRKANKWKQVNRSPLNGRVSRGRIP